MNSFGVFLRMHIFGESHGTGVGVVLDGVPAGIALEGSDFEADMARRQPGAKGTTARKEEDKVLFLSGVWQGRTTGAPLTLFIENKETRPQDYVALRNVDRPGHADFVARHKFKGFQDDRGGGHFSGRLTVALVAAGVVAKKIIPNLHIRATLIELMGRKDIEAVIEEAIQRKDSIGGVVACEARGVPIGLGSPFFGSVESQLSALLFSIPAVKAVGFGSGKKAARMWGSRHNDAILNAQGETVTNHAGGINGGITNGNPLYFKVTIKPASSTPASQYSYHKKEEKVLPFQIGGRHDLCIALRVPVVVEAACAFVLADLSMATQP